jgi:hypothetical protein
VSDEPERGKALPIDHAEPMATQSRQTLMIATENGWLNYRRPVNMNIPVQAEALQAELGDDVELPTDGGTYYLVYIPTVEDGTMPVLIPEGDARAFVFALAATRGRVEAQKVQYRPGTLPAP